MPNIAVKVCCRIARTKYSERIVSNNTDYTITFDFDEEWADTDRTARFSFDGGYVDVPFNGDTVSVPSIPSTANEVKVGVYAGSLRTTSAAEITVVPSCFCSDDTEYIPATDTGIANASELDPADTVRLYDKSVGKLVKATLQQLANFIASEGGSVDEEEIIAAINTALEQAKASGEFDGLDGVTPTIGNNGNWFLDNTDTEKPSRGDDGKSAYEYAQDGGYSGTEEEFAAKLAAEKLPNPYPLTFTGAVSESYDGSSAKTIEIPSGGGGSSGSYFGVYTVEEDVSQYRIPFDVSRYKRIVISVNQPSGNATSLTIGFVIDGLAGSTAKEGGVSRLTYFMFDVIELTPGALNNYGKYAIYGYSRRSNNPGANTLLQAGVQYVTTEENSLLVSGNDDVVIPQGSIITITAIP